MPFRAIAASSLLLFVPAAASAPPSVTPYLTDFYSGARLQPQPKIPWAPPGSGVATAAYIQIDRSRSSQTILGFGTALTESASFNYAGLNATMQLLVADLLYGADGNGYTLGRMHMNSADFSLETYNMDNVTGDFSLAAFDSALTHDSAYVVPFATAMSARAGGKLKLFFSPWSPPGWMKNSGTMINSTVPTGLRADPQVHAAWALYFVKFAEALASKGLRPWGLTVQNEPLIVMSNPLHQYESCAYSDTDERDFLRDSLGPALEQAGLSDLIVMAYDWNKGQTSSYMATLLADEAALKYLGGVAVHWYAWRADLYLDELAQLAQTPGWNASKHVLLATEACFIQQGVASGAGGDPVNDGTGVLFGPGPPPGNGSVVVRYGVGELYLLDALGDISFGAQGWVDWNALLDYHGGPNHINRSDISAPILVDTSTQSVYVQAMYYYIGHLSRFVAPGWTRVDTSRSTGVATAADDFNLAKLHIEQNLPDAPSNKPPALTFCVAAAFASPDGTAGALVALNVLEREFTVTVTDDAFGSFNYTLPPRSAVTFVY